MWVHFPNMHMVFHVGWDCVPSSIIRIKIAIFHILWIVWWGCAFIMLPNWRSIFIVHPLLISCTCVIYTFRSTPLKLNLLLVPLFILLCSLLFHKITDSSLLFFINMLDFLRFITVCLTKSAFLSDRMLFLVNSDYFNFLVITEDLTNQLNKVIKSALT